MRRQLARDGSLPLLMRVYGLKPWDIPRLTGRELADLLDDLEHLIPRSTTSST